MTKYNLKPGDKFGRLTITWDRETRNKVIYEKCVCDCGNIKRVSRYHLIRWKIRSCWCLMKEINWQRLKEINTKHWMFGTVIYKRYRGIYQRCNNPRSPQYHNYWWRWIKCEWETFEDFYRDMGLSFYEHCTQYWNKNTSIDRIDVNWNYCKENCRRATCQEQQNNRRDCIKINYEWIEFSTIVMFAEHINKPIYIVRQRLSRWWTPKEIVNVPVWMNRHQYYKNDKYKFMPMAQKVEYQWKIYPSIKDFCKAYEISYNSYSNLTHKWMDKNKAIEKLLNEKFNSNGNKINFVN